MMAEPPIMEPMRPRTEMLPRCSTFSPMNLNSLSVSIGDRPIIIMRTVPAPVPPTALVTMVLICMTSIRP